jgi:nucleoid DNA-binding protein
MKKGEYAYSICSTLGLQQLLTVLIIRRFLKISSPNRTWPMIDVGDYMAKKLSLPLPNGWILLRVFLRGVLLVVGLCWFVHINLSSPTTLPPADEVEPFLTRLARKANVTEQQVQIILEELGPAMIRELARGNRIHLSGLGDFQVEPAPGYLQHQPHTDRYQFVPTGHAIQFHPAGSLSVPGKPGSSSDPKRIIN